ncbi:MAG: hypothetical protein AB7V16_03090 [Vulcanibacillus sp.]
MCMFILTYGLFYLLVPFIQTYFGLYRNNISWFAILLNRVSIEEIFLNFLLAVVFLTVIIISYSVKTKSSERNANEYIQNSKLNANSPYFKKVIRATDVIFIFSVLSILLLIRETGSLSNYLSLGVLTRGIDKDTSVYISSSYLQLVTASVIVLATPYLYLFLYRLRKSKALIIKLIVSLIFSIIFLLYNQGRASIIIFFLPFIFTLRNVKRTNILGLGLLMIFVVLSLDYIDAFFKYLAYGYFPINNSSNHISTFLGEFSYPFANFTLRHDLIEYVEYRFGIDYLVWPITMIPNSLLKIIGFSKENIISVLTMNTNAYGAILGAMPTGGIPVDFLTINFYQFGYISLLITSIIVGRLIKYFDRIFAFFRDDFVIKIVLYRLSFSIINILNNNDLSAIVRNRLDVVLIAVFIIYIYKAQKNYIHRNRVIL